MPNRLRHIREGSGLSLLDVSHKTGIDPGLLSRYERGESGISDRRKQELADFYGCSIPHLMGWDESPLITRRRIERGEKVPNGHNGEGHAA